MRAPDVRKITISAPGDSVAVPLDNAGPLTVIIVPGGASAAGGAVVASITEPTLYTSITDNTGGGVFSTVAAAFSVLVAPPVLTLASLDADPVDFWIIN
jgi:hypothetical protein